MIPKSRLTVGRDLSGEIAEAIRQPNTFVVTDSNVWNIYRDSFRGIDRVYVAEAGEDSKSLAVVEAICKKMSDKGMTREATVAAVGGGVVGDLAGFAAAVYMRGVKWMNIPTSLLAQSDSCVGGKTGVDLGSYKNLIGAFHQPERILLSLHWLPTLPEREWICGLGEVVKTAFLDRELCEALTADDCAALGRLKARDEETTERFVSSCIRFKEKIVMQDFNETGLRKVLNLGHTIGHACEAVDHHRKSHGEYVLIGLAYESRLFSDLVEPEFMTRLQQIVAQLVSVPRFDRDEIIEAALRDKKNPFGKISIMVPVGPAKTKERLLTAEELSARWERYIAL